MKKALVFAFLLLGLNNRFCFAQAESPYPDRPFFVRVMGTLLPIDEQNREDLVAIKVFVQGQPWLLRLGNVEALTPQDRERVVRQDILLRQVRFYGPDELIRRLRDPKIVGKTITIEGRLDTKQKRFLVKSVEEASTVNTTP